MARRRAASETRRALLAAARAAFTARGFDQVGLREITACVGVNVSLINRYFGSKERLFAEAMEVALGLDTIGEDAAQGFAGALAAFALDRPMEHCDFDPILAMLRSAPVEQAQPILREFLAREAIEPIALRIGGEASAERASLIVGFLLGVIILRGIMHSDPLASSERNDLAGLIERVIAVAADPDAWTDPSVPDDSIPLVAGSFVR